MPRESKPFRDPRDPVSASEAPTQVEKILGSEIFARSERLSKFLRYTVEQTLEGKGATTLKEQVIAQDVFVASIEREIRHTSLHLHLRTDAVRRMLHSA